MTAAAPRDFEALCVERGLRMIDQRRAIAKTLSEATDHPDIESLHPRVAQLEPSISVATVYRTLRLMEDLGLIERHDFGDAPAGCETSKRRQERCSENY